MKKKKRLGKVVGVIILLLIVLGVLWVRFVPAGKIGFLNESDNVITRLACSYPVTVSGESMTPFFKPSEKVTFNKCFDEEDLQEGIVIIFRDGSTQRLGIIRYIQDLGRIVYKVSNEARSQDLIDVAFSEIVGVNDADTSGSSYVYNPEDTVSTELADYMSEAYLGAIPRGTGLENAEIRRTMTFNLDEDKFCFIVNPIVEIRDLDIEIYEVNSSSIAQSLNNIIYSIGPNVNCINSYEDPMTLASGDYVFRIYINNVLVESADFQIE